MQFQLVFSITCALIATKRVANGVLGYFGINMPILVTFFLPANKNKAFTVHTFFLEVLREVRQQFSAENAEFYRTEEGGRRM